MPHPPIFTLLSFFSFFHYTNGVLGLSISYGHAYYASPIPDGLRYPLSLPSYLHDAIEHYYWTEVGPCGAD